MVHYTIDTNPRPRMHFWLAVLSLAVSITISNLISEIRGSGVGTGIDNRITFLPKCEPYPKKGSQPSPWTRTAADRRRSRTRLWAFYLAKMFLNVAPVKSHISLNLGGEAYARVCNKRNRCDITFAY